MTRATESGEVDLSELCSAATWTFCEAFLDFLWRAGGVLRMLLACLALMQDLYRALVLEFGVSEVGSLVLVGFRVVECCGVHGFRV